MRRGPREDRLSGCIFKTPWGTVIWMNSHVKDTERTQDPKFEEAEAQIQAWQPSRVHAGDLTLSGACRDAPAFLRWLWINKTGERVNMSRAVYLGQACLTCRRMCPLLPM